MKRFSESTRVDFNRVSPGAAGTMMVVLTALVAAVSSVPGQITDVAQAQTEVQGTAAPGSTTSVRPKISMRVVRDDLRAGDRIALRGRVGRTAERYVRIEVRRSKGQWQRVGSARLRAHGFFKKSWRVGTPGRYQARARVIAPKSTRATGEARRFDVYRAAHASWYGPGFYGGRTACGQRLTTSMVGVAHKSLPCGTRVTFRYGGREVVARVIDRGPFIAGREWDLTGATKRRLGFPSTGTVLSTR